MEKNGSARVRLDLLADHANVDVQRSLVPVERRTPNAREQLLALDDALRRFGQQPQDVELARGQINDPIRTRHPMRARIDSQLADRIDAVRRVAGCPHGATPYLRS